MTDEELDRLWRKHAGRLLHIAGLSRDWKTRYLAEGINGPADPEASRLGRALLFAIEDLEDALEREPSYHLMGELIYLPVEE